MKHNIYNKLITVTILLCSIVGYHSVSAQNSRYLTLNEAISLSLQNSKQLKVSQAKIDEATATLKQTTNNRLPDIKASGSYLRVNNPDVSLKVKLGSSNSGSGSGGSEGSTAPAITVDQAAYAIVNASLPLFSGFRIHYGIEAAKYLKEASQLDAENDREAVTQNAIAAYSNLYKAKRALDLVKENLKQNQQRVEDFSHLEQNGIIARNDLLKAELGESNIELSQLDAENNLKITYVNMDLMLGLPEGTELIPDSSAFDNMADAGTIVSWEQSAMQNRKDIAALSFREKANQSNIKSIQGEYYPGIALSGGYIAADIPNLLTVANAVNIGVGLQYNLANIYKTPARIAYARAQLREIQANEGLITDQVRIQINQAYENYLLSVKKIDVYKKALEQATENYKITKNKYDNNLVTTTDLLDADVAQLQARLDYAFSKADAIVAYKKLQQTAGILKFQSNN